jgi:hypothetical protein
MGSVQLSMYFLSGCTDFFGHEKGGRCGKVGREPEPEPEPGWELPTSNFQRPIVNEPRKGRQNAEDRDQN